MGFILRVLFPLPGMEGRRAGALVDLFLCMFLFDVKGKSMTLLLIAKLNSIKPVCNSISTHNGVT